MADVKELMPFTILLVIVGVLLGVGILVVDSMGSASYNSVVETSRDFTEPTLNNTNITLFGPLLSDVVLSNGTVLSSTNRYKVYKAAGVITWYNNTATVDRCIVGGTTCKLSYTWKEVDSVTETALGSVVSDGLAPIASTWMGLLVTIVILGIILGIVVTSFAGRR